MTALWLQGLSLGDYKIVIAAASAAFTLIAFGYHNFRPFFDSVLLMI